MRSEYLKQIRRVVVKLGTGVITDAQKLPDLAQMRQLVAQVAALRRRGLEVVLVTSGAVGSGMGVLGLQARPADLPAQQACAAVGQSRLMSTYEKLFKPHKLAVAQVLLTHEDLEAHDRHFNARETLSELLKRGVVPIVNENDAVSVTELKFGDNDKLSALVATLLTAELLVILTTVDGVIDHFGEADARRLSIIENITSNVESIAGGTASATAVGGMRTKIQAARIVVRAGIPLAIASGHKRRVLRDILAGKDEGTLFLPDARKLSSRRRWIAFFNRPQGKLRVDEGAQKALTSQPCSLLLPGLQRCDGDFDKGDVVSVCNGRGKEFARGVARHDSAALRARNPSNPIVIHRDDLIVL
ncbi:MAG: glutamate 5-kinase [Verrucomicrobia bacterium]|nr:glutamate 5-kinase [Verrucomicrobiota bacterium]